MSKFWSVVLGLSLLALPCRAQSVVMLSGGGSEGDIGDTTSWSYRLYRHLLDGGDVNGDGQIKVAVIADSSQSNFIPLYFQWLGASAAFNVIVPSRAQANDPAVVDVVRTADAIFIKGGDQGRYYDLWNDTRLEENIRTVAQRGGGIGGTSAGAMSLSEFAFAGSQDLISLDVLQNAQTPYLDDTDGGSGIHTDFLGMVANTVVDSHFHDRGRLGRLLGIMARASADNARPTLLGIGLSDKTGLWLVPATGVARVLGVGSVSFLQQTAASVVRRPVGAPLFMSNVRADVLVEGWAYDLGTRTIAQSPTDALPLTFPGSGAANSGALTIRGTSPTADRAFALTATYAPQGYAAVPTTASPFVRDAVGFTDALDSESRGAIEETIFRALYDAPTYSGLLVPIGAALSRTSTAPDALAFSRAMGTSPEAAAIVIDPSTATSRSLSPYTSNLDAGNGSLRAAAFVNLRVHVLGQTAVWGTTYNTRTHALQP
jgi:cyanophycinase